LQLLFAYWSYSLQQTGTFYHLHRVKSPGGKNRCTEYVLATGNACKYVPFLDPLPRPSSQNSSPGPLRWLPTQTPFPGPLLWLYLNVFEINLLYQCSTHISWKGDQYSCNLPVLASGLVQPSCHYCPARTAVTQKWKQTPFHHNYTHQQTEGSSCTCPGSSGGTDDRSTLGRRTLDESCQWLGPGGESALVNSACVARPLSHQPWLHTLEQRNHTESAKICFLSISN